ncbi:MAG: VWA domain-containing protein [Acidobacteria bacterium]|nr:VWA domain-containing protein [Acidobacteriota bacterium]
MDSPAGWTRRRALAALSLGAVAAPRLLAQAQDDGPGAVFQAGVDVVNVFATVRDKKGALITTLTKDDFELHEDGRPQTIEYFATLTDLPLTVGLLVDTSRSQERILEEERTAGGRFFERVIDESKDQAFLINFDYDVTLVQDLTSSRKALSSALDGLHTPGEMRPRRIVANHQFPGGPFPGGGSPFPGGGGPFPGGRRGRGGPYPGGGGPYPGGGRGGSGGGAGGRGIGTALYDSVYLAANDVLQEQSGRKAVVLISDGVDMGSKMTLDQAVEAAQRADVVVYSIYYADEALYGRFGGFGMGAGRDGDGALKRLSEQTGGRMEKVSKHLSLNQIFDQIDEELRSQYSLGYRPSEGARDGFREIKLKAKGKYDVFTRAGYYPKLG